MITWFLFDLGNTLIKLAYERVLENLCRDASVSRDELVELLESPGGYRDMERGAITFADFYESSATGPDTGPRSGRFAMSGVISSTGPFPVRRTCWSGCAGFTAWPSSRTRTRSTRS